jgi:hypothetical protein
VFDGITEDTPMAEATTPESAEAICTELNELSSDFENCADALEEDRINHDAKPNATELTFSEDKVDGAFLGGRGLISWQEGDPPAEIEIRHLWDGNEA